MELNISRKSRDFIDLVKIIQWLLTFNPFAPINSNLRCIKSVLCSSNASDKINYVKTETIAIKTQTKVDKKIFSKISFKRSGCVVTLVALQKSVKCNDKVIYFDPLRLFTRLISILEQTHKLKECFQYELTLEPTALFKDGFMCESNKYNFKKILIENAHNFETYPKINIVLDGGLLFH